MAATSGEIAGSLRPLTADPARAAVFSDIDGTLAPIVERAEDARVPPEVARQLAALGGRYACVACVSGRGAASARALVGEPAITYAGLHGAELLAPGADVPDVAPAFAEWTDRVAAFVARQRTPELGELGIRIEDKGPIEALHWRGAPDADAAHARVRAVAEAAEASGFAIHWGRMVLEVRPPVPVNKGQAIRALVAAHNPRVALYAGDDATDLDAFDALDALVADGTLEAAVRVGVRSDEGPSSVVERADIVVDGVDGMARLLGALDAGGAG